MFLELSRDKIMIVLELYRDKIMTNTRNCNELPESSRWAPVDLLEVIGFFIQQTFPF